MTKTEEKMTRREKRFLRRKARRENARKAFLARFDNFGLVLNRKNLFKAGDLAKKRVMWKGTVQRWSTHQLLNTERLYRDLKAGKDVRKGFSKFDVCERGKIRHISAVLFYERVVQKALCREVLAPLYQRFLLFDNSASQKGKGTVFAWRRLETHLRRFYKKHGANGYVLVADFKSYFDNISHDVVKKIYRKFLQNQQLLKLTDSFVDAYDKGLGLGSETSQMQAVLLPKEIDDTMARLPDVFYGRYMDDSYFIAKNKNTLQRILAVLKQLCKKLKITLSERKTAILSLKNGILWLKTKFFLLDNGKIIRKICRTAVTRERRKLKKQLGLLKLGRLKRAEIRQSFESWAGGLKWRNARRTLFNLRHFLGENL